MSRFLVNFLLAWVHICRGCSAVWIGSGNFCPKCGMAQREGGQ